MERFMSFNIWLRGSRLTDWSERAGRDVVYAWRGLRRSRGFTLAVVLVLALGLGANAAIFSVLDHVFLSAPVGVDTPQEIRRLYSASQVNRMGSENVASIRHEHVNR
jgi:hypothetical protein